MRNVLRFSAVVLLASLVFVAGSHATLPMVAGPRLFTQAGSALYYGYTPTLYAAPTDQGAGNCTSEVNACDLQQALTAATAPNDVVGALPGVYTGTPTGGGFDPMFDFAASGTSGNPIIVVAKYPALYNMGSPSLLSECESNAPYTGGTPILWDDNSPCFGSISQNYTGTVGWYINFTTAPPRSETGVIQLYDCTGCFAEANVFDGIVSPDEANFNSIHPKQTTSAVISNNWFRGGADVTGLTNHNWCHVTTYGNASITIANNTFGDRQDEAAKAVNCGIFVKGTALGNTIGNNGTVEKNKSFGASKTFIDVAVVRGSSEGGAARLIVRENLSINDGAAGGQAFGCRTDGEGCRYVDSYHNTAVANAATTLYYFDSAAATDLTCRDNVGVFTATVNNGYPINVEVVGAAAFSTLNYNWYSESGATAEYAELGVEYAGLTDWSTNAVPGFEGNSTESAPTFVDSGAGDYRLSGDTGSSTGGARGITTAPASLGAPGT